MACHEDSFLRTAWLLIRPLTNWPQRTRCPTRKAVARFTSSLHRHLFDSAEDAHDELNRLLCRPHPRRNRQLSRHAAPRASAVPASARLQALRPQRHRLAAVLRHSACGRGRITQRSTGSACTSKWSKTYRINLTFIYHLI